MGHHGAVSSPDPVDPAPSPETSGTTAPGSTPIGSPPPGSPLPGAPVPGAAPPAYEPSAVPSEPAPIASVVHPVSAPFTAMDDFVFAPAPPSSRRDMREPSGRRGQNRLAAFATVALVIVLAFGSGIAVGRATAPGSGEATAATAAPSAPAASGAPASVAPDTSASPAPSDPLAGLPADGPRLGSTTAKVQLTYWADFQCPFCAKFAQEVLPQLASRIADGTVSVVHRDFVFIGPESLDAAVAVRCAGEQAKFWPMHDAVYAAQDGENQGTFTAETLAGLAAGVGVDATKFTACTQRHDVLVSVLADTSAGTAAGVKSTPTIDIPGRRFLGVPDVNEFLAAIDAAAKAGTAPTPAPTVQPSGDPWVGTTTSGRTAGSASAPVTVELWVDYQATGMPAIVVNLEPGLKTRIDAGKVQAVQRDLATLGDESILAASFVRCGAQANERFVWFAHDILASAAQGANAGVFTSKALLTLAAKLGWDVAALDQCLTDPATAAAVKAETAVGTGLGFTAAPAVVVKRGAKEVARFSGSSLDPAKVLAAVDAAAK
jgi:protein-disulfide isomerase